MNSRFLFTLVNNNSSGNREINLEIEIYLVLSPGFLFLKVGISI